MTKPMEYFRLSANSISHPDATIVSENARFSFLSPRVVRMEYSPYEQFLDAPSQVFLFRHQAAPKLNVTRTSRQLRITSSDLVLHYRPGEPFTPDSLTIEIKADGSIWSYGDLPQANLGGTARTLDRAAGPIPLEEGLLNREGWTLIDDSSSLIFNEEGWLEPRLAQAGAVDLYFFAYGSDFTSAIQEYYALTGPVPLIPRWALGNWWSRYWAYSQQELGNLMLDFRRKEIPLSVCIIDMDWHIVDTGVPGLGWTGYTWNRRLFPDPPGFLNFLHELGLKTALNLHPADGIHPHESAYPQMASILGIDPDSGQPVVYDPTDPDFVRPYFELLHHPMEAEGVDFWWMDWQQGNPTHLSGLNLLWWINHIHFTDLGRSPEKRPFVFSRWGGPGNHRYPIGFSGDTIVTWESLAFQPYFTATASNVGYSWWSHDIGGHMSGIEDAELYLRWVQFGVLSPIFRLHSTNNQYHERRPWGWDAETERLARTAMQFRHALIPYLYSMAWRNTSAGIPLVRPLYHLSTASEAAYACPQAYAFGSELIAAPFTTPADPETRLSRQAVWLPEGEWYGFMNNRFYQGDAWHAIYGARADIPLFARAGAIIPMGKHGGWGGVQNPTHLEIHLFPGQNNHFDLYEDDGESQAYLGGKYAITSLELEWEENRLVLRIGPAAGQASLLPEQRDITLVFHACDLLATSEVRKNGEELRIDMKLDHQTGIHTITIPRYSPQDRLEVVLTASSDSLALRDQGIATELARLLSHFRMESESKRWLTLHVEELAAEPSALARYISGLLPSQRRALLETATGCGFHTTSETGSPLWVVWNNQGDPNFVYTCSQEDRINWRAARRFPYITGSVPRFTVYHPEDAKYSTLTVRLEYSRIYSFELAHCSPILPPK